MAQKSLYLFSVHIPGLVGKQTVAERDSREFNTQIGYKTCNLFKAFKAFC